MPPWIWPPLAAFGLGIGFSELVVRYIPEHAKKISAGAKVIGCGAAGAAIGSALPVVGTALGGVIGLGVGAIWAWATR